MNGDLGLQHYGNKVKENGITFDSKKEYNFYKSFLENSGVESITIHEKFDLLEKNVVNDKITLRGITYRPDFVVRNGGEIKHVFDVKNSFGTYGVDRGAGIVFKLFAKKYKIPVEVVVVRTHDFKVKILGTTKKYEIQYHNNVDYDWRENDVS